MNLKPRNRVDANFSMSGLTDIIFLLLIFFMLTSTLVSPNAVNVQLPNSDSQVIAKRTLTVTITKNNEYFVNNEKIQKEQLIDVLQAKIVNLEEPTVVLDADKSIAWQHVVEVMTVCSEIGATMIAGTEPN